MFLDDLTIWPRATDEDAARVGMERWHEHAERLGDGAGAAALAIARHPAGAALLSGLFANSPHLTRLLLRDQDFAISLLTDGPDAALAGPWQAVAAIDATTADTAVVMTALRRLKRLTALATAVADVTGAWPLDRVTGQLSDLAELAIAKAWRHALADAIRRGRLPLEMSADPLPGSGVICLAMGKLGARELNYSSDIDLIVFYDDEIPGYRETDELQRSFGRMVQTVVRVLEERTADGYVFRTDLRLRPDASATPLAISTTAAEAYYAGMGQNWERAAMIKARPVGSDMAAAGQFLDRIRPFVWRKNLDFAAIQDIHSIKRQIAAHKGGSKIAVEGHNVKLGRGGIREVEFFVQTQQLIWGGRDVRLRSPRTDDAMAALVEVGRVKPDVARVMLEAYAWFRTVEHRLQMVADAQTHVLPDSAEGLERLAGFLSLDGADTLRRMLLHNFSTVAHHYADLFEDSAPLTADALGAGSLVFTGVDHDPETLSTLAGMGFADPEAVSGLIRGWHHGRYRATRNERARQILTELTPALLTVFGKSAQPDEAFRRFDRFLERLPQGVPVFSLFHANPPLLELTADVMSMAPSLASHLAADPALFEGVLVHDLGDPLADAEELAVELERDLRRARDYEDVLDGTRRWINGRKFQLGVQMVQARIEAEPAGRMLSDIVDTVIRCLVPRVEEEFARRHGHVAGSGQPPLAVIAMGKLGGRLLSFGSDLDLVFIYDAPLDAESDGEKPLPTQTYFMRLSQRLLAALTAKTAEGELFEVDMRLRPTGNKGPIATSLEGFLKYHAESAWTWERMALTRSRVVAGDPALARRVTDAIAGVLSRPRDADTLLRDVADMRARMLKERRDVSPWDLKHRRGGLVDCEFIAQYLQLRHAAAHPEVVNGNTAVAFERLAAAGALDAGAAATLARATRQWSNLQGLLRLSVDDDFDPATAPPPLKARLAQIGGAVDFAELEQSIEEQAGAVLRLWQAIVAGPAAELAERTERETAK